MDEMLRLQEAEELLRLMASRFSLAAEGRDPEIDDAARALRKAARNGLDYERLHAILDRISARMLVLDDDPPDREAAPSVADDGELLRALLRQVRWPERCVAHAQSLLEHWPEPGADAARMVDAVSELIMQALPERRGMDDGLIESVVNTFLQRLDLGAELYSRAEQLLSVSQKRDAPAALSETLHSLADLIAERLTRLQRQRNDLEAFLDGLGARLGDVAQQIEGFAGSTISSLENARELSANMQEQVEGLSTQVSGAHNLEQLKLSVHGRLNKLLERVNDYCSREEARNQELEEQVESLSGRLQALESEGQELRSLLTAEHEAATTDALTGVPNRLAYDMRIEQEFQRWQRIGGALSLVVLDIDHFKRLNDAYGHRAGDKALSMLAQVLRAKVRDSDFFGRYGGEEFALILPGTPLQAALGVAEKLRAEALAAPFHHRGARVELTLSGGIATFGKGDEPAEVFERADRALYRAKLAGRNRCETEA
ncbi:diguanylate cyclase [Acidihalobacter prosperus]